MTRGFWTALIVDEALRREENFRIHKNIRDLWDKGLVLAFRKGSTIGHLMDSETTEKHHEQNIWSQGGKTPHYLLSLLHCCRPIPKTRLQQQEKYYHISIFNHWITTIAFRYKITFWVVVFVLDSETEASVHRSKVTDLINSRIRTWTQVFCLN